MAFLTKVGNMFRQTANRQITSEISVSGPSIYQALRYMSSSKLFVGGISFQTDDNGLKEAFDKYGNVVEARIIMDHETVRRPPVPSRPWMDRIFMVAVLG
ncbi:GLYCINE-RICH RNA-BINDING PROTEIN 3 MITOCHONDRIAL [Salix purpurea]|uniref:GLYCINE-RICH RNA-BINDING PROTEIN 3 MITOCHONDRIAL n=1 Tax=Salix purpurea TaxID=77065 RepID=A0A9Q1A6H0_SALPP|nr:GLYCINE-RICH RNA-BINDING PROTEIN 3 MITOCHONDRIAL [Salix purpurea]